MKVFWTLEARERLLEIQAYISQFSPQAARSVTARLLLRSRKLASPPITGRRLPEYSEAELREVLERPFRADIFEAMGNCACVSRLPQPPHKHRVHHGGCNHLI